MRGTLYFTFVVLLVGCSSPSKVEPGPGPNVEIVGKVVWMTLEGGFWAIRGNNRNYEPINLPPEFEEDGLAVVVEAKIREDLGSFRMVGPVIEITTIKKQ